MIHFKSLFLFFLFSTCLLSQTNEEVGNPIIYGEFFIGGAGEFGENSGVALGGTVNYQLHKGLFTFRYSFFNQLEGDAVLVTPFIAVPVIREKANNNEFGLMYGPRWVFGNSSLSLSGGISLNGIKIRYEDIEGNSYRETESFVGFPFEINFKWFKSEKRPYRIFWFFPVGKPTSFGRGFGFKLFGNISNHSYIGLGLVLGIGAHKNYN